MAAPKALKRKASSGKGAVNKRKVISNQDFEDLGDGSETSHDANGMGELQDPMIDPQYPSDIDDEDSEEGEDQVDRNSMEEEEKEQAVPSAAGPSISKSLFRAPTLLEMEQLREADETGGTTFSLQLSDFINSALLSTTPDPGLRTLLSALHDTLLSMPPLSSVPPAKAAKRLSGVKIPFVGPEEFNPLNNGKDIKWTLGWEKPEEVVIGGSWGVVGGWKKGKKEMGGIDLVVVMPSSLFSPKDRLDYRYFHKRSHYLAVILSILQKRSQEHGPMKGITFEWSPLMGDERRPGIVIFAGKGQGLKDRTEIRIHSSAPPNLFPISSLAPSKSLVRTTSPETEAAHAHPTPLYNSSILYDMTQKSHLLHLHRLHQIFSPSTRTLDSYLILWRTWAKRRGIPVERGGSGWLAGMVLGWVVNGGWIGGSNGKRERVKKINGLGRGLSAWAALRAAWEFLAQTDFHVNPVYLHAQPTSSSAGFSYDQFLSFEHVFTDPTGLVNLFAEWLPGDIGFLKYHARETLAMLEDESGDMFPDVFLRDFKLGPGVFDEYIQVDISNAKFNINLGEGIEHPSNSLAKHLISTTLSSGLSNRISLLHLSFSSPSTLHIGLIFESVNSTRVLDIGPSSDQAGECETFRQLWGAKAELRRFKDGTIAESVVWDLSRPEDAGLIPGNIVKHLLSRHYSISEDRVSSFTASPEWLKIVQIPDSARDGVSAKGSEKQGFRPTMSAYDQLYKTLKDMDDDLPLAILNVQPSSPLLRYSATFVPHPIDVDRIKTAPECVRYVPYADVIVQFESSPKWPDDLAAIQKVKLALFDKLAKTLQSKISRAQISIVLDNGASEIEDSTALEILLPEGVAFRLRIYYEREQDILQRAIDEEKSVFATSLPLPSKRAALPALARHTELFQHLPTHHSSLAPLHHRYPSYSAATRLLKRWFAAHILLGEVIREEAIELIMAGIYLEPGKGKTPSSAVSGFLRALELLAGWDWTREPLFVPILTSNSPVCTSASGRVRFPPDLKKEAVKAFESLRTKEKGAEGKGEVHPWIITTENDLDGRRWTKKVGKAVAIRAGVLARATVTAVRNSVEAGLLDVKGLFTTPLGDYDFTLHLNTSHLPRSHLSISADPSTWDSLLRYRNLSSSSEEDNVRVGFDPAELFVKDLRKLYGDSVIFFHDVNGGNVIAGVWNPKLIARGQKAFLGWNSKPVDSGAELVEVNRDAILGEVARLGKGLIERIMRN